MTIAFTDEQKRLVNSYYPGLGTIPPNVGAGGLLGIIEDAFNEAAPAELGTPDEGAAAGTGVVVTSTEVGHVQKVTLTLTDVEVPLTDEAGVVAYGGLKVFDWPAGLILFMGAVMDLALTKDAAGVNDDWDGDISLGTVTASNNATLSSTEQDLIPTTATPQAVAGVTTGDGKSTSTEAAKVLDGTATAKDMFLNILVDDADHNVGGTATNIIVNGTITFSFLVIGDI